MSERLKVRFIGAEQKDHATPLSDVMAGLGDVK